MHRYIFAGFLPGLLSGLASLAQSEATVKALSKLIISDSGRESLRWSLHTFVVHFENGGAPLPSCGLGRKFRCNEFHYRTI